jgi:hypothetical protein
VSPGFSTTLAAVRRKVLEMLGYRPRWLGINALGATERLRISKPGNRPFPEPLTEQKIAAPAKIPVDDRMGMMKPKVIAPI